MAGPVRDRALILIWEAQIRERKLIFPNSSSANLSSSHSLSECCCYGWDLLLVMTTLICRHSRAFFSESSPEQHEMICVWENPQERLQATASRKLKTILTDKFSINFYNFLEITKFLFNITSKRLTDVAQLSLPTYHENVSSSRGVWVSWNAIFRIPRPPTGHTIFSTVSLENSTTSQGLNSAPRSFSANQKKNQAKDQRDCGHFFLGQHY